MPDPLSLARRAAPPIRAFGRRHFFPLVGAAAAAALWVSASGLTRFQRAYLRAVFDRQVTAAASPVPHQAPASALGALLPPLPAGARWQVLVRADSVAAEPEARWLCHAWREGRRSPAGPAAWIALSDAVPRCGGEGLGGPALVVVPPAGAAAVRAELRAARWLVVDRGQGTPRVVYSARGVPDPAYVADAAAVFARRPAEVR